MFEYRKGFENHIGVIPAELEWREEEGGYFPIELLENNEYIIDLANSLNKRLSSYLAGRSDSVVEINKRQIAMLVGETDER